MERWKWTFGTCLFILHTQWMQFIHSWPKTLQSMRNAIHVTNFGHSESFCTQKRTGIGVEGKLLLLPRWKHFCVTNRFFFFFCPQATKTILFLESQGLKSKFSNQHYIIKSSCYWSISVMPYLIVSKYKSKIKSKLY